MSLDALLQDERPNLERRLRRLVGDHEDAADLTQEALLRAWRSAPREESAPRQRAWLHRTATNLAIDMLRRRTRRATLPLAAGLAVAAVPADPAEAAEASEALAALQPHERFVLLLRFDARLSFKAIGALLDVSEEAARKRVDRAREAFTAAWRSVRVGSPPLILLVEGENAPAPYRSWLEGSGARVRLLRRESVEREVAVADALVFCGSVADVDPTVYGEHPRVALRRPDGARDRADLVALRLALRSDVPIIGVCRGAQLLNVALGGALHQDLLSEGVTALDHDDEVHAVRTVAGSRLRAVLGGRILVRSEHHQGVRTAGRGLRAVGHGPDGVVEAIELPGRRLVLGIQWHPEHPASAEAGARVAEAVVHAATKRPA